jgi:hypothetical protein
VLIKWLQYEVRASSSLPLSARIEVREALERLKWPGDDETSTIAAWQCVREGAPRIWNASQPIRDALIGAAVQKALGVGA